MAAWPAGTSRPAAWAIGELPPADRSRPGPWQAYRLRMLRRRLLGRAIARRRELISIRDRTDKIVAGQILCLAVVRNEALRLPHFLAHHRRLGVDHFILVDNASTDGTADLLAGESDVSLFGAAASYRDSRFGLDWLNWLLMRHGHGHWCLVLDADELFVYPHWETRPLGALAEWLDSRGRDAIPAMLLDLYPRGPLTAQEYRAGQDPLEILEWFDSGNYIVQVQPRLRNLWIQGGVRTRAFFAADPRRSPTLNKVPFARWHWRHAWHNSTHNLLPARRNAVFDETGGESISGVLLHTKFLHVIAEKSAEERVRGQHFADPARHAAYYDALIEGPVLHCSASRRYHGWRQLEALGLMSRGGWV